MSDTREKKEGIAFSLIMMIIFASFAMRSPMGCIGPLMDEIRSSLGLSATLGGLISTLTMLMFSFASPFAVVLSEKIELKRVLPLSFAVITLGVVLRSLGSVFFLFSGTVIMGFGTGLSNVAVPSFFKEYYPEKNGRLTGIYSASLTVASASTAAFIEPLASSLGGWNLALLSVFLFPLGALAFSLRYVSLESAESKNSGTSSQEGSSLKRKIMVAVYMGLQSLLFFTVLTWYPTMITGTREIGVNGGLLITITQIASFFPAYIIPVVCNSKNITKLSLVLPLLFIPGIAAAYFIHNSAVLIAGTVLFGLSLGATFSMGITLCAVYGKNGGDTARMVSFGQCLGYLLAAFGPTLFGTVYDVTSSWTGTVVMMMVLPAVMSVTALGIRKE